MKDVIVPRRQRLTRAESKARTRQQLLDAAAELLARKGVNRTSLEEIAETAGYSIGAFYSNFPSKEALLVALLDEHMTASTQDLVRRLDREGTDLQTWADIAGSYFDEIAEGHQAWFLLSAELWLHAVRDPALRPHLARVEAILRERIERVIARRFAMHGYEPPRPVAEIARIVLALVDGLVQQTLLDPTVRNGDAFRAALGWLITGQLAEASQPPQSSHSK